MALGSNLGSEGESSIDVLERALRQFPSVGLQVTRLSSWWRSAAWPDPSDPPYCNGVALVATSLGPSQTLAALHAIEVAFGRVPSRRNAPRILDLDLIAYGRQVAGPPGPCLPHPRAHERRFVMGPLAEIAPDWVHPVLGQLAGALADAAEVGTDAAPVAR